MKKEDYLIWYASLNLLPIKKFCLFDYFKEISNIYKANEKELLQIPKIDLHDILAIQNSKNENLIKKYLEYINKNEIKLIDINDKLYPNSLKNIYDPPIVLFAKGNIELLGSNINIAVIGSRNADNYGLSQSHDFAYDLSKKGITIISGLAKGIDTMAHMGALKSGGNTIAVVGSGLDIVYPKENYNLYNQIINKGLVISEFIVGTKPIAQNFPMRNRIVSALSNGIFVIEASMRSGAIITVDFALEQGKNVYALPGNVNSVFSMGCNQLIKEGAKMVTSINDILADYLL